MAMDSPFIARCRPEDRIDRMTQTPIRLDRTLLKQRRRRALADPVAGVDFLVNRAVDEVAARLAAMNRQFEMAVDLGGGGGRLGDAMVATGRVDRVLRADSLIAGPGRSDLVCDEETLPFRNQSIDLAVSLLQGQFVNDLPGFLVQLRRALRPDGLFFAVIIGGDSLFELRTSLAAAESELTGGLSPRVLPMIDLRDLGGLMQRAGFALPVIDVDAVTVRYDDIYGLMRDLRAMAASNILADRLHAPTRRSLFALAADYYRHHFADADGRIRATFELISASGWAPHESQQKPLRPGSATHSLADALRAIEAKSPDQD